MKQKFKNWVMESVYYGTKISLAVCFVIGIIMGILVLYYFGLGPFA